MVPFAETVMWKVADVETKKLEATGEKGVVVGKSEDTDEWILITRAAVQKSRAIHRLAPSARYDKEFLAQCVGTPWNPRGKVTDQYDVTKVPHLGAGGIKKMYITRAMRDEIGPTPGCRACEGESAVLIEECRVRFENRFGYD